MRHDRRAERLTSVAAPLLFLLVVTVLAYFSAAHAGYVMDDAQYVVNNRNLRSLDGLWRIWFEPSSSPQYYPLVFTSFWMEYQLWGPAPLGYHVVNVVLHALNAVLVWQLLKRVDVPGAFLAAVIFTLHPVHAESVVQISARKDLLSGAFSLLTPLLWLRFVETRQPVTYAGALILFAAAMCSKTAACTLPLVLLLLLWWKKAAAWRREIPYLIPFLALGIGLGCVTVWCERLGSTPVRAMPELSLADAALVAGRAVWFYAGKLLWPAELMAIYPRWEIGGSPWEYVGLGSALAAPMCFYLCRRRWGRAPLVAVLFFGITLAPALGFIPFAFMRFSYVADHFQYLASLGLIALAAALVTKGVERLSARGSWPKPAAGAAIALLLGGLTWQHARVYTDGETLWRDNLAKNPQAWSAHYDLGTILLSEAQAEGGRGVVAQTKLQEAIEHFTAAIRMKPDYAEAYNNWGLALQIQGHLVEAQEKYAMAMHLDPYYVLAYYNFAVRLFQQGKLDDGIQVLTAALQIAPDAPSAFWAHGILGSALVRQGKLDEALTHLERAVQLKPDYADAEAEWGLALELQGKTDEAIQHYRAALRIDPRHAEARANLQRVLARAGGIENED